MLRNSTTVVLVFLRTSRWQATEAETSRWGRKDKVALRTSKNGK